MAWRTIELHPAAVWVCDDCGREHFIRCTEMSTPPGESTERVWIKHPAEVTCEGCGAEFEVEYEEPEGEVPA